MNQASMIERCARSGDSAGRGPKRDGWNELRVSLRARAWRSIRVDFNREGCGLDDSRPIFILSNRPRKWITGSLAQDLAALICSKHMQSQASPQARGLTDTYRKACHMISAITSSYSTIAPGAYLQRTLCFMLRVSEGRQQIYFMLILTLIPGLRGGELVEKVCNNP